MRARGTLRAAQEFRKTRQLLATITAGSYTLLYRFHTF
jgi:hypothetical protein